MEQSISGGGGDARRHTKERFSSQWRRLVVLVCALAACVLLACSGSVEACGPDGCAQGGGAVGEGGAEPSVAQRVDSCRGLPQLQLVWPPDGHGAAMGLGVWCAREALPVAQEVFVVSLGDGVQGRLLRGAGAHGGGWAHCVRLQIEPGVSPQVPLWLPARLRNDDGAEVACIEPTLLYADRPPRPAETLSCDGPWQQAGHGCLMAMGQSGYLQTPPQPLLWIVHAEGTAEPRDIVAAVAWDTIPIALSGSGAHTLTLETIDLSGAATHHSIEMVTP